MIPIDRDYLKNKLPKLEIADGKIPHLPESKLHHKIEDKSDTHPIDQKQFALMFGDTILENTGLAGGTPSQNAAYYLEELRFWETDPMLSRLVPKETRNQIRTEIEQYTQADALVSLKDIKGLQKLILENLEKYSHCTVPIHVSGAPGHVFSCVIEKNSQGQLSFYFLNRGDGAERHPVIKQVQGGKTYLSYRSTSYALKDRQFFTSETGELFLETIATYASKPKDNHTLTSSMAYEDLSLFADQELTHTRIKDDLNALFSLDDLGITPQRSGTCPEHAIRLIIRDGLLRSGITAGAVRQVMFANKLRGLKNGYHHLDLSDPESENAWLLKRAAEGISVQALKLKQEGLLDESTLEEALLLVEKAKAKAEAALLQSSAGAVHAKVDDFSVKANRFDGISAPNIPLEQPSKETVDALPESKVNIDTLLLECIEDPQKLEASLIELKRIVESEDLIKKTGLTENAIASFILKLPVPESANDRYWEAIAPENTLAIIEHLHFLVKFFAKNSAHSPLTTYKDLMLGQVSAIIHKLLMQQPAIKEVLENYSLPMQGFSDQTHWHMYYSDPQLELLDARIKKYYSDLKGTDSKKRTIFSEIDCWDPKFTLEQFFRFKNDLDSSWKETFKFYEEILDSLGIHFEPEAKVESFQKVIRGTYDHPLLKSLSLLHSLTFQYAKRSNIFPHPLINKFTVETYEGYPRQNQRRVLPSLPLLSTSVDAIYQERAISEVVNSSTTYKSASEELLRLRFFKETRIPLLIDWCHRHRELLHLKETQAFIEECLLTDNILLDTYQRQPEVISSLRALMDSLIEEGRTSVVHSEQILALNLLSAQIESRLTLAKDEHSVQRVEKIQSFLAEHYEKVVPTEKAALSLAHQIYIFALFPDTIERNPEKFLALVTDPAFAINGLDIPHWMRNSIQESILRLPFLAQQEHPPFISLHLDRYLGVSDDKAWTLEFPYAKKGDFSFNLLTRRIFQSGREVLKDWPEWIARENDPVLNELRLKKTPFITTEAGLKALDDSWEIVNTGYGRFQLYHPFTIGRRKEMFTRHYPSKIDNLENPHKSQLDGRILWRSVDDPQRFLSLNGVEPASLFTFQDNSLIEEELLNGIPTGNFAIPIEENPLREFLQSLPNSPKIKSFCKKDAHGKWLLSKVSINQLTFEREVVKGKQRLKCLDIPGYYLSEDQWMGGLMKEEAIWVESEDCKTQKAILFPDSFPSKLSIKKCQRSQSAPLNHNAPLILRLDTKQGKVVGDSALASLCAVKLFLDRECYKEAFDLLDSIDFREPLNEAESGLIKDIIQSEDKGPAATALKLHAYTRKSLANQRRVVNAHNISIFFSNPKKPRLSQLLSRYRKFCGSTEIHKIPDYLRFPEGLIPGNYQNTVINPFSMEIEMEKKCVKICEKYEWNSYLDVKDSELLCRSAIDEPYPGKVDLLLYSRFRRSPHEFLYALLWLYRKTRDEKLIHLIQELSADRTKINNREQIALQLKERTKTLLPRLDQQPTYSHPGKKIERISPQGVFNVDPKIQLEKVGMRPSPFREAVSNHSKKAKVNRLPDTPSPFATAALASSDPLTNRMQSDLLDAHETNLKETYVTYQPVTTVRKDATALIKTAETNSENLLKQAKNLLERIETLANYPDQEALTKMTTDQRAKVIEYRLRQHGQQSQLLTLRDPLLTSLLMRNGSDLQERNPFLSPKMVKDLQQMTLDYLDLMNQKEQADAALPLLRQAEQDNNPEVFSKAVSILAHKRRYDLYEHPEIALYEYASGHRLRPEQTEILLWIIENGLEGKNAERVKQLCFEFQAGGGKTKVLSAILAARAHAEGKVPIFFSIPHLEEVTQADLRDSLTLYFERKLTRVQFSIKQEITVENVTALLDLFHNCLAEKRTLFMSPETWHALHLAKIHGVTSDKRDLVKKIDELFDLFKEKGVALIDEGDVNADALHETNRATGTPLHIPARECDLFATLVRHLIEDSELKQSAKLAANKQSTTPASLISNIQSKLADLIYERFQEEIPNERFNELKAYWLDSNAKRPQWMQKMWEDGAKDLHLALLIKRIDLVRGILNEILPFTLTLSNELDYQPPKVVGEEVWIPAKQGIATGSNFQNPDVAAFVSCQATFQVGLNRDQLRKVIEKYATIYDAELHSGFEPPPIEERWKKIQQEAAVPPEQQFTLEEYRLSNFDQKEVLIARSFTALAFHSDLIQGHLVETLLPQVTIYPKIEQSTATNLVDAFSTSILFSAALGTHEKYSLAEEHEKTHRRDFQFLDQVVTRALLPHNSSMHWIQESTPKNLLDSLNQAELEEAEGIINVGAFCEKSTSEEWADAFLSKAQERNLDKKAALFFKTDEKGNRSLWLKIASQPPVLHNVVGSNLRELFKELKLRDDQVYKIFAPSETTGTDFPISPKGRMLLSIGSHVNLSLAAQAIMRMRGFLNDPISKASSQKISWVGSLEFQKQLHERFPEAKSPTPEHFFIYALEQEAEKDRAAIVQQAVQEIEAVIFEEAEFRRKQRVYAANAYFRTVGRDPSATYGGDNHSIPTQDFLNNHALSFAKRCGFHSLVELPGMSQERIRRVIARASNAVPTTTERQNASLSAKMEQEAKVEQKQEQRQQQQNLQSAGKDAFAHSDINYKGSLFKGLISKVFKKFLFTPNRWVGNFFSKDLLIFKNALAFSESKDEPSLMPANLLLIEEVKGVRTAFALSDRDAVKFIESMQKCNNKLNKKLCIVTSSGQLVHNGTPKSTFTAEEFETLQKSDWMKERICEINFWNGKIVDREWMLKKLDPSNPEQRAQTIYAWDWISKNHINSDHPQIGVMEDLKAISDPDQKADTSGVDRAEAVQYPELKATNTPQQKIKTPVQPQPAASSKVSARQRVRHLWKTKRWFKAATVMSFGMGWLIAWGHYARTSKNK